MRQSVCLVAALCFLISGCGGKKRVALPRAVRIGSTETGVASWYGIPYHGRRAANGEIYDMEKMTAAHRTLPFGTWVRVKSLDNGKTVDVRITDRGPFVGRRILDLSHAAAVLIDMIGPGTAKVKLTVIRQPADPPPAVQTSAPPQVVDAQRFAVQVGSYADRRNAERIQSAMERSYGRAALVMRDAKSPQWRVLVGSEATLEDAENLAERIRADPSAQAASAFVVRIDQLSGLK